MTLCPPGKTRTRTRRTTPAKINKKQVDCRSKAWHMDLTQKIQIFLKYSGWMGGGVTLKTKVFFSCFVQLTASWIVFVQLFVFPSILLFVKQFFILGSVYNSSPVMIQSVDCKISSVGCCCFYLGVICSFSLLCSLVCLL